MSRETGERHTDRLLKVFRGIPVPFFPLVGGVGGAAVLPVASGCGGFFFCMAAAASAQGLGKHRHTVLHPVFGRDLDSPVSSCP